jgi:hypothetical protein
MKTWQRPLAEQQREPKFFTLTEWHWKKYLKLARERRKKTASAPASPSQILNPRQLSFDGME